MADISTIDWSPLPCDGLVLRNEKKEVMMALVENRMGKEDDTSPEDVDEQHRRGAPNAPVQFDDFVEGKGRGLIVLLQYGHAILPHSHALTRHSGPPGIGNTLTAETIPERLKRPFYSVCDLFEVQARLANVVDLRRSNGV